jgi:ABC-type transport system involved in multi-copper enzyme maturation permease subunit
VGVFFLAAAGALTWFGRDWSATLQLGGWGLLLIVLLGVLAAGPRRLAGPVLFYDLVAMGRRPRFILVRGLYALALLLVLFLVYEYLESYRALRVLPGARVAPGALSHKELARLGQAFFTAFLSVQFLAVLALTPAYTAGAIAEEKDRRTLEFLLATDLGDREIVLSKLLARVANLALIVLTGLPVLSLLQFWGGVDPELVLAGFIATVLTMFSLACVSILVSVYARKTREALVLTYLALAGYQILAALALVVVSVPAVAKANPFPLLPFSVADLVGVFNAGNPVAAYFELNDALSRNKSLDSVLPGLVRNYALFHGLVALVSVVWAVGRMRVVALAQGPAGSPRKRQARARSRRRVGRRPMLWKELFAEPGLGFNWFGRVIIAGIILVSFVPALWIAGRFLYDYWYPASSPWGGVPAGVRWYQVADAYNQWVRLVGTLVACLTLLGVGVRAASSVSGERDRQTLDALLTSPLEPRTILYAKWVGSLVSMRWAALWLLLIWGIGLTTGGLDRVTVPWLGLALVVYAAFMASLGLWFSVVWPPTTRATLATLVTAAVAGGGHWALGLVLLLPNMGGGRPGPLTAWLTHLEMYALTPPITLSWLAFHTDNIRLNYLGLGGDDVWLVLLAVFLGLVIWGVGAFVLYQGALWRFREACGRGPRRLQPPWKNVKAL